MLLYDNTEKLSPQQRLSITKFAADLAPLSTVDLEHVAMKLAAMLSDDEAKELLCVVHRMQRRTPKVASAGSPGSPSLMSVAGKALVIAAAAIPLVHYFSKVHSSDQLKAELKSSYNVIKQRYPDMATDPMFDEEFSLIAKFSPTVASQPIPTANIIRQLHRLGPESVTPQLLEQLIGIEESKSKTMPNPPSGHELLKNLGSSMSGVLK